MREEWWAAIAALASVIVLTSISYVMYQFETAPSEWPPGQQQTGPKLVAPQTTDYESMEELPEPYREIQTMPQLHSTGQIGLYAIGNDTIIRTDTGEVVAIRYYQIDVGSGRSRPGWFEYPITKPPKEWDGAN